MSAAADHGRACRRQGPDGSDAAANIFGPVNGVVGVADNSLWFNALLTYAAGKSYYQMLVTTSGAGAAAQGGGPQHPDLPGVGAAGVRCWPVGVSMTVDGSYYQLTGVDSGGALGTGPLLFKFGPSDTDNGQVQRLGRRERRGDWLKRSSLRPSSGSSSLGRWAGRATSRRRSW